MVCTVYSNSRKFWVATRITFMERENLVVLGGESCSSYRELGMDELMSSLDQINRIYAHFLFLKCTF